MFREEQHICSKYISDIVNIFFARHESQIPQQPMLNLITPKTHGE